MKRSLIFGLLAFLLLYALSYGLYLRLSSSLSVNAEKERNFKALFPRARLWFMGDSHPLQAVLADSIPGAFNWASSSESYVLTYFKISSLLAEGYRPDCIILPLEYHSLSAQGCALWLGHELDDIFWKSKTNPFDPAWIPEFNRWYFQAQMAPFAGQFYKTGQAWNPKRACISPAGFQKDTLDWSQNPDSLTHLQARIKSHFGKFDLLDSVQIRFLGRILQLAEDKGIKVWFVRYPLSEAYLKSVKALPRFSLLENSIEKIVSGQKPLDFRHIFRRKQDYFSDPDHLSEKGARVFYPILKEALLRSDSFGPPII
jgi:hypothetical protein